MQQHEREAVVGAFLDITVGTWHATLDDEDKTVAIEQTGEGGNRLAEYLLTLYKAERDEELTETDKLVAVQAIALMSDETLLTIVTVTTGANPLEV